MVPCLCFFCVTWLVIIYSLIFMKSSILNQSVFCVGGAVQYSGAEIWTKWQIKPLLVVAVEDTWHFSMVCISVG